MGCCSSRIVNEGQALGVWNKGRLTIHEGPAKVFVGCTDSCEFMTYYSANERQFVVIRFLDGHTEHMPGPRRVMSDPRVHDSVTVSEAMEIEAGEVLVVNRKVAGPERDAVQQVIIRGPRLHVPEVGETTHQFEWHGSDAQRPEVKRPKGLKFTKLRCIPDQMYLSVPEVRTADDALVVVNLMIFFELADVELLLQRSHDPIADFMNSATADAVSFASTLTYELFLEKTDAMNSLETYPQLTSRAKSIGYRITKVVYRGYTAGGKLQQMHDDAIQARTQLRLEAETEEQAQRLADLKLSKEAERQKRKQDMQSTEVEHNNRLSAMQSDEKLSQEHKAREMELAAQRSENEERVAYLKRMKEIGVDLTQYLVAQYQRPAEVIQVTSDNPSNVHVHAHPGLKRRDGFAAQS